ncbi:MAG TPA: hypothetical protein VH012_05095, partial [Acidimicrobiales bacterium]|nr:hypothetical protein [Acidimicrobiales bacterium]
SPNEDTNAMPLPTQPSTPAERDRARSRLRHVTRGAIVAATGATVAIGLAVAHDRPGVSAAHATTTSTTSTSDGSSSTADTGSTSSGATSDSGTTGTTGNTGSSSASSSSPTASSSSPTVTSGATS